ncbi:MAG: UDP-N-acetylmuramoyl-tripeptide--D-alanyl-D-alanine ligase [Lachnospiraceae bacterium]|nr:UDP-N-acetylmuramoyl-tripeptide--D-alanyl-D-alanine ligase [Lachnospiraceae bacterium]
MKDMTLQNIASAVGGNLFCREGQENIRINKAEVDSRRIQPGDIFIATVGERTDGHRFIPDVFQKGAAAVICEKLPEEPEGPCIQVKSSLKALEDMASYYRSGLSVRVVGITGSVGKTSTKEVVAAVLSRHYRVLKTEGNLNSNIGLPLMVLRIKEDHEVAVLEMGVNHFDEMERMARIARPEMAVITNIGTAHIENLGSQQGIFREKSHIFDYLPSGGKAILNGGDPFLKEELGRAGQEGTDLGQSPCKSFIMTADTFGRDPDNTVYLRDEKSLGLSGSEFTVCSKDDIFGPPFAASIPIPGPHMVENALCGALVGFRMGLSSEEIRQGLREIEKLPGRSHVVKGERFTLIDDCYNASPDSMGAAFELLRLAEGRRVCILGDMFELGKDEDRLHYEVGERAELASPSLVVCIGKLSKSMAEGAGKRLGRDRVRYYETKEDFLKEASELLQEGDTCLVKASHSMGFEKIIEALC